MVSVDVFCVPAVTFEGSVPKDSSTSSFVVSSSAEVPTVTVFDASPAEKATLAGSVTYVEGLADSGIVIERSATASSLTVTLASLPSATLYVAAPYSTS